MCVCVCVLLVTRDHVAVENTPYQAVLFSPSPPAPPLVLPLVNIHGSSASIPGTASKSNSHTEPLLTRSTQEEWDYYVDELSVSW